MNTGGYKHSVSTALCDQFKVEDSLIIEEQETKHWETISNHCHKIPRVLYLTVVCFYEILFFDNFIHVYNVFSLPSPHTHSLIPPHTSDNPSPPFQISPSYLLGPVLSGVLQHLTGTVHMILAWTDIRTRWARQWVDSWILCLPLSQNLLVRLAVNSRTSECLPSWTGW